jgi:hypothetical protein
MEEGKACCQNSPVFFVGVECCGGVLDEPYNQLTPLSGVAVASLHRLETCPSYVAWRGGVAAPLSGLAE